ncbi:TPA-induced transmembrane protein homolog [Melanotaenia boesemani]|uniref:TPA-induced transmembrane protein homolog n=1 Tax=Melanotaenia boesemani TaxID=1250792 RepID=UPI001C0533D5|nr:TPA-induced transmembrane protein homolog [Melanotaenia boesemani]
MTEMDEITSITADNGAAVVNITADATETDAFLIQNNGSNGRITDSGHEAEGNTKRENENCSIRRIKEQLNEIVFWRITLWMVLIALFFLIILVIIISLAVCTALHEDEDEKFDSSLFTIPHYFTGSFQMSNISSTPSQVSSVLHGKLTDLYRSSPALGRYFSKAEINDSRNDSIVMKYNLMFLLPEEEQEELRNFTLSREVVYNVFRQFLYDQDPVELRNFYIVPVSLEMSSMH